MSVREPWGGKPPVVLAVCSDLETGDRESLDKHPQLRLKKVSTNGLGVTLRCCRPFLLDCDMLLQLTVPQIPSLQNTDRGESELPQQPHRSSEGPILPLFKPE